MADCLARTLPESLVSENKKGGAAEFSGRNLIFERTRYGTGQCLKLNQERSRSEGARAGDGRGLRDHGVDLFGKRGLDVIDFDRMRKVGGVPEIDRHDEPAFGPAGFREVRPELQEVERRGPGRRRPASKLGKATHLLQEFHQFNLGSHHSILKLLLQFTCQWHSCAARGNPAWQLEMHLFSLPRR